MSIEQVQARVDALSARIAALSPTPAPALSALAAATATSTSGSFSASLTDALSGYGQQATSDTAQRIINSAEQFVGMPYVWGGSSPADGGMDCSGLVQYVYGQAGIDLPRVSADQARSGVAVPSLDRARPGDLVAWDNSGRNVGADHIAIYLGDGMILEAPRTGLDIRIISLADSGHGTPDYIRRVVPDAPAVSLASVSGASSTDPLAALRFFASSGTPGAGGASATVSGVPYADVFNEIGARYQVPPTLLAEMARAESGFNPRAVSPAGAQGLMQLMPGTAAGLGVSNSFDVRSSVDGAARLMSGYLKDYADVRVALAAYNAGPGNVAKYGGVPPFAETQNYIRKITTALGV